MAISTTVRVIVANCHHEFEKIFGILREEEVDFVLVSESENIGPKFRLRAYSKYNYILSKTHNSGIIYNRKWSSSIRNQIDGNCFTSLIFDNFNIVSYHGFKRPNIKMLKADFKVFSNGKVIIGGDFNYDNTKLIAVIDEYKYSHIITTEKTTSGRHSIDNIFYHGYSDDMVTDKKITETRDHHLIEAIFNDIITLDPVNGEEEKDDGGVDPKHLYRFKHRNKWHKRHCHFIRGHDDDELISSEVEYPTQLCRVCCRLMID